MASITINISDDRLKTLQHIAQENGVSPEELLQASMEDWLSHPKSEFSQAAQYVLAKNAKLYQHIQAL
ncbi:DNA-binding protein [Lusitaniella coriacea]|uniref:DNA-binding protein n=1 Tax=Lusitaniella coriacea TaxID=1983105 RepID=UPI003CE7993E